MQIIKKNLKQGEISIKIINPEDLWFLNQLIGSGDIIKGKTERKIKIGGEDERQKRVIRKTVFLKLTIEKTEFKRDSDILRVSGIIIEGPEDVPRGSHHTFNVEPGSVITLKKDEWLSYQLSKLKEASEKIVKKILVLLFDREQAIFVMLKDQGQEVLTRIKGDVAKKGVDGDGKNFYKEITKLLLDFDKRLNINTIIIASPSFWKEYLNKELPEELKSKSVLASCSDVDEANVREVLQRPEVGRVLEKERSASETILLEKLLKAISHDEGCYGIKECVEKINFGAVKDLLVSYEFLQKCRDEDKHKEVENAMKTVEKTNGEVHILSSEAPEKKLIGLGGIAGILRWKSQN